MHAETVLDGMPLQMPTRANHMIAVNVWLLLASNS